MIGAQGAPHTEFSKGNMQTSLVGVDKSGSKEGEDKNEKRLKAVYGVPCNSN